MTPAPPSAFETAHLSNPDPPHKLATDPFLSSGPLLTLAHESAHPVGRGCEHDSSWGTLHLSTKRRNAGTPMLARAGEGFAIRTAEAGAGGNRAQERGEALTQTSAGGRGRRHNPTA